MDEWYDTRYNKPTEKTLVHTKVDDEKGARMEQDLIYYRNLWFFPDMSMYVYYTPTHWRMIEASKCNCPNHKCWS